MTNRPKAQIKPPQYSGEADVELFISQFSDIADINEWSEKETTLHLRTCLEGAAADCGRARRTEEIYEELRARFGITPRQARHKLSTLKRNKNSTLHEYGAEISRLVQLAYPDQSRGFQRETALEIFGRSLNHQSLQQHLLARPHDTILEAVRICEEYLQIEDTNPNKTRLAVVDTKEEEKNAIQQTLHEMKELMVSQQQLITSLLTNKPAKRGAQETTGLLQVWGATSEEVLSTTNSVTPEEDKTSPPRRTPTPHQPAGGKLLESRPVTGSTRPGHNQTTTSDQKRTTYREAERT